MGAIGRNGVAAPTQDQANELTALAQQYGSAASQDTETRLQQLEAASLEHDAALIELAGQLALLLADKEADQAPTSPALETEAGGEA